MVDVVNGGKGEGGAQLRIDYIQICPQSSSLLFQSSSEQLGNFARGAKSPPGGREGPGVALVLLCSPAAWLSLFTSFGESCLGALVFCTDCRADWTL